VHQGTNQFAFKVHGRTNLPIARGQCHCSCSFLSKPTSSQRRRNVLSMRQNSHKRQTLLERLALMSCELSRKPVFPRFFLTSGVPTTLSRPVVHAARRPKGKVAEAAFKLKANRCKQDVEVAVKQNRIDSSHAMLPSESTGPSPRCYRCPFQSYA
jgi:hypothetical protein